MKAPESGDTEDEAQSGPLVPEQDKQDEDESLLEEATSRQVAPREGKAERAGARRRAGARLAGVMERAGLTVKEVAAATGIDQVTITGLRRAALQMRTLNTLGKFLQQRVREGRGRPGRSRGQTKRASR